MRMLKIRDTTVQNNDIHYRILFTGFLVGKREIGEDNGRTQFCLI